MSNDNTGYDPGRMHMAKRMAGIMAMQDPEGLTPAEASDQAMPEPLFGGSEMVIPYMIAGVLGLIAVIVWLVFK